MNDAYLYLLLGEARAIYLQQQRQQIIDNCKTFSNPPYSRSWHVVPAVVESVVMQHPAVHIAVVVGLPHEEDGDHPTAVVVLSRGCNHVTPEEIEKFVEERVDDRQKLRGGVKIVDHLPLTPTGKVKRRLLRQMVLSGEI